MDGFLGVSQMAEAASRTGCTPTAAGEENTWLACAAAMLVNVGTL